MNERVLEIVNLLLKLLLGEDPPNDENVIVQDLLARGYELDEIGAAFELIFSNKKSGTGTLERQEPGAFARALNDTERQRLTVEAWGFLVFCSLEGLLLAEELEEVLLYVSQLELFQVGLDELGWLLRRAVRDPERLAMMIGGPYPRPGRKRRKGLN